jgi:exoribonuclease-2
MPVNNRERLQAIAHAAMIEGGLAPDFDPSANAQAQALQRAATDASAADLRSLLWCSIDNDDSLDLDQLSVSVPAGDKVRILVAVADVDALVPRGSPLDAHAQQNTTSVYTSAQIFPMLPEKLSTDLTSLAPDQERLALVVDMTIDGAGAVVASSIYRATVVNRAKLAYGAVAAWLEGQAAAPAAVTKVAGMDEQLRIQDRVAQALRAVRHAHGALTLETLQTHAVFDGDTLRDLTPDRKNRAQDLIEDFMVAANGVTAQTLARRGFSSLRRVLRTPKRWERIVALASELGERLPATPDARALNAFLARRRQSDPAHFPDLSLSVIKSLGRGEYALDRPGQPIEGHFGLAVSDYTHSTAPNRRYPDLLTQRLMKAALAGTAAPYSDEQLDSLAAHCTAQEDAAAKVERRVSKSAAALLLESRVGQHFDAIVTGVNEQGTWVRIDAPPVEGRLMDGHGLDVGQRLRVQLRHTDVERGFIDFSRDRQ